MKNAILSLFAAMAMIVGLFIASTVAAYAEGVEPSAQASRESVYTVSAIDGHAADGNSIQ